MAAVRMERIDFFEALAGGIRFFRDHPRRLQVKKALNRTASAVAFLETDERRVIVKWRPENNLEIQMYNGDATFGQLIIYEHEGELPAPPELPDMVSVLLATHLFTADATIGEEDLTALIDQRFGVAEPSEEAATSPQN